MVLFPLENSKDVGFEGRGKRIRLTMGLTNAGVNAIHLGGATGLEGGW